MCAHVIRVHVKIAEGFAHGKQRPPRPLPAVRMMYCQIRKYEKA